MNLDDMIGKIICGDCLEVMKDIPDKSIDLVLTDPPYGIKESNEKNLSRHKWGGATNYGDFNNWDKEKVLPEYFAEIKRISKNQIIFGGNYYGSILGDTTCYLVWDKDNGDCDFADCELAWTSFKTAVRKFTWRWRGCLQQDMKNKEERVHLTQKPLPLFKWCLNKYSQPNDLILDPFSGSCTTAVACKLLNRRCISIEISPEYCAIGEKRLRNTLYNEELAL